MYYKYKSKKKNRKMASPALGPAASPTNMFLDDLDELFDDPRSNGGNATMATAAAGKTSRMADSNRGRRDARSANTECWDRTAANCRRPERGSNHNRQPAW